MRRKWREAFVENFFIFMSLDTSPLTKQFSEVPEWPWGKFIEDLVQLKKQMYSGEFEGFLEGVEADMEKVGESVRRNAQQCLHIALRRGDGRESGKDAVSNEEVMNSMNTMALNEVRKRMDSLFRQTMDEGFCESSFEKRMTRFFFRIRRDIAENGEHRGKGYHVLVIRPVLGPVKTSKEGSEFLTQENFLKYMKKDLQKKLRKEDVVGEDANGNFLLFVRTRKIQGFIEKLFVLVRNHVFGEPLVRKWIDLDEGSLHIGHTKLSPRELRNFSVRRPEEFFAEVVQRAYECLQSSETSFERFIACGDDSLKKETLKNKKNPLKLVSSGDTVVRYPSSKKPELCVIPEKNEKNID